MDSSDSPSSRQHQEVPPMEQSSITARPPTPLEGTTSEELFDSDNNPHVTQFLSTFISRPRGPRESRSKPATQDLSSCVSAADTDVGYVRAFESPAWSSASSQDGSDDAEGFQRHKKRPDSGVIDIDPMLTWQELAQQHSATKDQCNKLNQLKVDLQRKSENDTMQIEQLQDALKSASTAKNSLMQRTVKAEKELADVQEICNETLSRKAELEGLNKTLRTQTARARIDEEKCRLLNQSMVNQMEVLMEDCFRKQDSIDQLKEDNANLMRANDIAEAEAQRARDDRDFLADQNEASRKLLDENSALQRELEAVRNQIEQINEQQSGLEDDIWKYGGGRLVMPDASPASAMGSWNDMSGRETPPGQIVPDTPALTPASTASSPSIASPQSITLSKGGKRGLGTQQAFEASDGIRGLGIQERPLAEKLGTIANIAASTKTSATYANAETLAEDASNAAQQNHVGTLSEKECPIHQTTHVNTGMQVEPIAVENQLEKLPYIDAEVQPSPREVFEVIRPEGLTDGQDTILLPTTYVDDGVQSHLSEHVEDRTKTTLPPASTHVETGIQSGPTEVIEKGSQTILLPETYVDTGVQPNMTENVETGTQTSAVDEDQAKPLRPSAYVDIGIQKDPEHVEVLRNILSEDPAIFPTYASRVGRQGLLKIASEDLAPNSSKLSWQNKKNIFERPFKGDAKPVYNLVGLGPRDLFKKMIESNKVASESKDIVRRSKPVGRDFASEEAEKVNTGSASPELPSLPFGIRDQPNQSTASSTSREKGTTQSSENKASALSRWGAAFLYSTTDVGTQTDDASASDISNEPILVDVSQLENVTPKIGASSINNKRAAVKSSRNIFELLIRSKKHWEQNAWTDNAEAVLITPVVAKAAWPLWYHVVLSLLIMVFLTHAFLEEKRFWRDANELTRRAVVSMRDEQWGSEWVEKIGFRLDQKLGVDRTGFC